MKSYSFAKVSARGYLTEADYNNKYILTEDLRLIINVSGRDFERPQEFFQERNITARFMPLTEKNGDMGYSCLLDAVKLLLDNDRNGHRSIVCCAFGVNRSRTVIEAFHYAKMGYHLEDEYEGFKNHLICNCESGFLPPLSDVELALQQLSKELIFRKFYSFAKVVAACHIYEIDYYQGNQIINVSAGVFSVPNSFFSERKTTVRHLPLREDGDMGFGNLIHAVQCLLSWDKKGKRSIVFNEIGNYNNYTVIEAFHYAKMGYHLNDRCKGYQNHLIYHSMYGHLPPLPEIEQELRRLGEDFNKD